MDEFINIPFFNLLLISRNTVLQFEPKWHNFKHNQNVSYPAQNLMGQSKRKHSTRSSKIYSCLS